MNMRDSGESGDIWVQIKPVCTGIVWFNETMKVVGSSNDLHILRCDCGEFLGPARHARPSDLYATQMAEHLNLRYAEAGKFLCATWEHAVNHGNAGYYEIPSSIRD